MSSRASPVMTSSTKAGKLRQQNVAAPNAFTRQEWSAYYTRKRIVQQWLQVHFLGTIDCQKVLEVGPAMGW